MAERDLFTKAMIGSWQEEKEYLKEIIREVIGDKTKEVKPKEEKPVVDKNLKTEGPVQPSFVPIVSTSSSEESNV